MEPFVALVLLGIALEAFVQLLKNAWDAEARSSWTVTRFVVVALPVIAALIAKPDFGFAGLDFGQDFIGYIISGLVIGRIAQWVHDIYKKTS